MKRLGATLGGGGWSLVELRMEKQIGLGCCTAEDYLRFFEGGTERTWDRNGFPLKPFYSPPRLQSWLHYQKWKAENEGGAPAGVNRIRTDAEFAAWAAAGFPEGEAEEKWFREFTAGGAG